MAEFVLRNELGKQSAFGHEPVGVCCNQRWIFHAARLVAAMWWIDYGEPIVGIRPDPLIVEGECAFQYLNVARSRRQIPRRHQDMKLHSASAAGPGILDVGETRTRAPGKIVHIFGVEGKRLRTVGIVHGSDEIASCAYDFILRKRHIHIERPEIREEFRGVVKLMAIPSTFPPHANLWKPLADHVKIA